MENCLVTQLKGNVDNNNIPKFDTAFVNYLGERTTGILRFYIVTGTQPVTVKSKKQFYVGTTHTTPVTEYTIAANNPCLMEYEASDIGADPVSELIEIDGIYNIKKIGNSIPTNLFSKYFDFTPTTKNGLSSLLNYASLDCFEGYLDNLDGITKNLNLQYAQVFNNSQRETINVDKILESSRLEMLGLITYTTDNITSVFSSEGALSDCSTLKVLVGRYKGDISDLPVNLVVCKGAGSVTTGTVESYVAKCVAAGRISGHLILQVGFSNVTLNGLAVKNENFQDKSFSVQDDNWINITWTNGVIDELSSAVPADISTYIPVRAILTWEPYPSE